MTTRLPIIGVDTQAVGHTHLNAHLNAKLNHYISVAEYGVVGNGSTDETAALQACIDAAPNWSTIVIPPAFNIRITSSILINNRKGLRIEAAGMMGASGDNSGAGKLTYDGANDGTMIVMDGARDCSLENLALMANGKAKVCIDAKKTVTATEASSFVRYKDLLLNAGSSPRTDWRGIQCAVSDTGQNTEHYVFEECYFAGAAGTGSCGLYLGGSGNSLIHLVDGCTFESCSIGLSCYLGSFQCTSAMLDHNGIDFWISSIDPCFIDSSRTEGANQFVGGFGISPLTLRSNAFGGVGSPYFESTGAAWIETHGNLLMEGNQFTVGDTAAETLVTWGASNGRLVSIGNLYTNPSVLTYMRDKFIYGAFSAGDYLASAPLTVPQTFYTSGSVRDGYGPANEHELVATRQAIAYQDFFGALDYEGTMRRVFGLNRVSQIKFGDPACALRFRSSLATPSDLEDGDCWIDFTGTTPSRQLRLNVRDGGVTYSQNIGAAH